MKNGNNIRKKFYEDLLVRPKVFHRRTFFEAVDKIFPCKSTFKEFLFSSADEQIEKTKYLLDTLSFENINSPPMLLHRKILSLQNKQKSSLEKKARYSRDHVKHIVYLYFTGIMLYSNNKALFDGVNKSINYYRRKFSIDTHRNLYATFSELWSQYAIYHDIGYPLEELGDNDLSGYILENTISSYDGYDFGLKNKFALRFISNIISILLLVKDKEEENFSNQIYCYLDDASKDFINRKFKEETLGKILTSYSYPNIMSEFSVSLVATIVDASNIYVLIENNDTAEIKDIFCYDDYKSAGVGKRYEQGSGKLSFSIRYFFFDDIARVLEEKTVSVLGSEAWANVQKLASESFLSKKVSSVGGGGLISVILLIL